MEKSKREKKKKLHMLFYVALNIYVTEEEKKPHSDKLYLL